MHIFPRIINVKVGRVFDEGEGEALVPAKIGLIVSLSLMRIPLTLFIFNISFP